MLYLPWTPILNQHHPWHVVYTQYCFWLRLSLKQVEIKLFVVLVQGTGKENASLGSLEK